MTSDRAGDGRSESHEVPGCAACLATITFPPSAAPASAAVGKGPAKQGAVEAPGRRQIDGHEVKILRESDILAKVMN